MSLLVLACSSELVDTQNESSAGKIDSQSQELYYASGTTLWTSNNYVVPMCWHQFVNFPSQAERDAVKSFVSDTIAQGWYRFTKLQVTWADCPTTGSAKHVRTMFRIGDPSFNGHTGATGMATLTTPAERVPPADPPGLRIGFPSNWNANDTNRSLFRALILHEFGHILGFTHEQDRPDGDAGLDPCYGAGNHSYSGITVGALDPASIMGWSYCASASNWLSTGDIAAAQQVYGVPPLKQLALWRHTSGQLAVWFMSDEKVFAETYPGAPDSTWKVEALGNFNGSGTADIFWRQTTTGITSIWYMGNGVKLGDSYPGTISNAWTVEGAGDFDGDGRSDILWRDNTGILAIWYDGKASPRSPHYPGTVSSQWKVEGIGDFDGDGKADIYWRNTSSGVTAIWYDGDDVKPVHYPGTVSADWKVEGVGDFDADGKTDVLWRQSSTGITSIWFDGDDAKSPAYPGVVGSDWHVRAVGDFNNDNRADVFWQQLPSGQTAIWYMNGGSMVGAPGYPRKVDSSWTLEGTHIE